MKKSLKTVALPLVAALSLSLFSPISHKDVQAETIKEGTVTAHWLTVRKGPSTNYSASDYIKKGTKVEIINDGRYWDLVTYDGKKGYVSDSYLKVTTRQVSSTVVAKKEVDVTNARLNVRSGPSTGYKIIGKLQDGNQINVHSYHGKWVYMSYGNLKGYVHSDFLKNVNSPTPTAPVNDASTYTVQRGDTLWGISNKYNTTVTKVKQLNNLSSNVIYVGQKLKVNGTPAQTIGALTGKVIVVDPGHGGRFAGAQGIVQEEDVNLDISLKLRDKLENAGAKVIMTRTSDVSCTPVGYTYAQDLACRPGIANKNNADVFISVHANAAVASAHGNEVFYRNSSRGDKELATNISKHIISETGLRNRGVKYADFAVLRHADGDIPSVLIETGFVTNSSDAAFIGSSTGQNKMAEGIFDGIVDYLE